MARQNDSLNVSFPWFNGFSVGGIFPKITLNNFQQKTSFWRLHIITPPHYLKYKLTRNLMRRDILIF